MVRSIEQHTGFSQCQAAKIGNLDRSAWFERVPLEFADCYPRADMCSMTSDTPAPTDAFDTLGVPVRFRLDAQELRRAWLRKASQAHPDAAGAVQAVTCVNDALRMLSDPLCRAQLLLSRFGAPPGGDRDLPPDFLMEMMELRERADEVAGDAPATGLLRQEAENRRTEAIEEIAGRFDGAQGGQLGVREAQEIRVFMNIVRAFDRVLEQLDREAGAA